MAGPACGILFPGPLTADKQGVLDELIRLVGNHRGEDQASFWASTTKSIGGRYEGGLRPFVAGFHRVDRECDPNEIALMANAIGFQPEFVLEFGAMSNSSVDHLVLAEIAVWVAETLEGVVDLHGMLSLPTDLPGRCFTIPYEIDTGLDALYQIVDPTALRAWCSHPRFRMVK